MKLTRIILSMLIILAAAASLFACKSDDSDVAGSGAQNATPAPAAQVTPAVEQTSGAFTYFVDEIGNVTITDYIGAESEAVIPGTIDGHTVTSIDASAFSESEIVKVTIPASISSVAASTFYDCPTFAEFVVDESNKNLVSVDGVLYNRLQTALLCFPSAKSAEGFVLPETVLQIAEGAFYGCTTLTSIVIDSRVTSIGAYAFAECTALAAVTLPDTIRTIGVLAFMETPWIDTLTDEFVIVGKSILIDYNGTATDVVIPDTVQQISGAFSANKNVTSIAIPSSVIGITSNAFTLCTSLNAINVVQSNGSYTSINGVLYDSFVSCLICYPPAKADPSFVVPDTVSYIMNDAFDHADMLMSITLPASLTRIGEGAFYSCAALTSATYSGTAEDWMAVNIEDFNDTLVALIAAT